MLMEKINQDRLSIITYMQNVLNRIGNTFYYKFEILNPKIPLVKFKIHNRLLEEKLPIMFTKDEGFYYTAILKTGNYFVLEEGFFIGSCFDYEGEEWRPEVSLENPEKIIDLSEEIAKLLVPYNLRIIDSRGNINSLKKPYLMHTFSEDNDYLFSHLSLEDEVENSLQSLPVELNLRIFYEFFKDLS